MLDYSPLSGLLHDGFLKIAFFCIYKSYDSSLLLMHVSTLVSNIKPRLDSWDNPKLAMI